MDRWQVIAALVGFGNILIWPFTSAKKEVYRTANKRRKNATHLFLLSPSLSGSTVIQQLMDTSPNVTTFNKIEGQWLPEAIGILGGPNRWDPNLEIDWEKVKDIFYGYWSPTNPIRFDKSPPHILRATQIQESFDNCCFIATIRNPYAQIEGQLRRKWMSSPSEAAEFWIMTAKVQIHNLANLDNILFFSYEKLTDETENVVKELINFLPEIRSLNPASKFSARNITGKPIKGLRNLNSTKIKDLDDKTIAEINEVLSLHEDILNFFGYPLIQPKDIKPDYR
jgi:hypothetical protein